MAKPGPPPTPTSMLEKRGSWRGGRNGDEPNPKKMLPPMPRLTGVAKQVWLLYEPILFNLGVLTQVDGLALEQLCKVYADWVKYDRYLKKKGNDIIEIRGKAKEGQKQGPLISCRLHPYVKLKIKAQEQLNRLLANFGMTPADRSRIKIDKGKKDKGKNRKIT